MRELKTALCIAVVSLSFLSELKAQLVINEIMQSNVETIMDDIKEFPDSWVELYNNSSESVDLSEYKIGITDDESKAYQLPSRQIPANGYVLIYCDKENQGLHTDFRLESGKNGEVYLYKGSDIVDKLKKIAKMPAPDVAYGREVDGGEDWGYQLTATPGTMNVGGVSDIILGEPEFTPKGGVYESVAFDIAISLPEDSPEGAVIRYTTDGKEPTLASEQYTGPLTFSTSKVIRAKIFAEGAISRPSTTQSYLILGRKVTLPVVSIVMNDKYLNDGSIGIFPNNDGGDKKADWRRPMNFEYFAEPEKEAVLNQLCETRVSGGASRGAQFKSQLVYANKRFGTKRLEYEFFPNSKPGLTDFKSIMLRNAGNDFDYMYFRDAAMQINMAMHADLDWQAYQPTIIFINGKYRGMLNVRERSNEDNIYTNYDGLEDIDMIENWYELKSGSFDSYYDFEKLYNKEGVTYAELDKVMDINEFLNLMILNIFHNNIDFPGNNIVMWKPTAEGGKWRWVCKDTDFGLGLYGRDSNYEYFKWLDNNNYDYNNNWANKNEHTALYHALINTQEGKELLINKFIVYMGDFLNGETMKPLIDSLYNNIKFEYPNHRNLVNQWWPNHSEEVNNAKLWVSRRTDNMWAQLRQKFSLGGPKSVNVNLRANNIDKCSFTYNGIPMTKGTLKGKDYIGRTIKLEGTSNSEDYKIVGWEVFDGGETKIYKGKKVTLEVTEDISYYSINALVRLTSEPDLEDPEPEPEPEPVPEPEVEPYISVNGIHLYFDNLKEGSKIELYNLQGQMIINHTMGKEPYKVNITHTGIYVLYIDGEGRRLYLR